MKRVYGSFGQTWLTWSTKLTQCWNWVKRISRVIWKQKREISKVGGHTKSSLGKKSKNPLKGHYGHFGLKSILCQIESEKMQTIVQQINIKVLEVIKGSGEDSKVKFHYVKGLVALTVNI
ncbi:hypothetical protein KFK09_001607 [Dendrobium nobile]|uniref:Uncharacterized protein n=1 Tax=Dendrobium nobile TaxID=94219 RepID=A0A8T3CBC7_DENNO|nr:hypothetical protein KFK09_001607 [Dendrobium nobile]